VLSGGKASVSVQTCVWHIYVCTLYVVHACIVCAHVCICVVCSLVLWCVVYAQACVHTCALYYVVYMCVGVAHAHT
jgi:hypothetical protein